MPWPTRESKYERKVSRFIHRVIGLALFDFYDKATMQDVIGILDAHEKAAQAMANWSERDAFSLAKRVFEVIVPYFSKGWHRREELNRRKEKKNQEAR